MNYSEIESRNPRENIPNCWIMVIDLGRVFIVILNLLYTVRKLWLKNDKITCSNLSYVDFFLLNPS